MSNPESKNGITYVDHKCINCGDIHKVRPADLKRGWGKHCSKSCAASTKAKKPNSNYKRFINKKPKDEFEFSNAHHFSNEEYFSGKD